MWTLPKTGPSIAEHSSSPYFLIISKGEEREALEQKSQLRPNFDFTPADKESALAKLLFAANQYDKSMPGAMSMTAFEEKTVPANVFKEQLRMVFNIYAGEHF